MNYNKFDQYIKNQEIYSNELHIILSKTPPKLFRITLCAIALVAVLLASFAFTIKYREFSIVNYVMSVQPNHDVVVTALATEQNVKKIANARSAVINFSKGLSTQEAVVRLDSMKIIPVYEVNGKLYENAAAMGDAALTNPVKKYKLVLAISNAAQYFGTGVQSQTGVIKFASGKKRLINKIIHLP